MEFISNYIDGVLSEPVSAKYIENIEPATGLVYSMIPDSGFDDVELAVGAANRAFKVWSHTTVEERSLWLQKMADGIKNKFEEFVLAESVDNGKPVFLSRKVDIPRAISNLEFYAKAITQYHSEAHINTGRNINYTIRHPLGPVACISPWNLPLYLFTWKIAPALAAGNTVVAKPSEITPYTAYLLSKVCKEIGLPKGVLNILHGYGSSVGDAIVRHKKIKAVSFTGGTKTGAHIASVAAPEFKKMSLELGGKNPNIIFSDCNYEQMLKTTVQSSFANQGQICLCGSRIFVEDVIYDRFKNDFIQMVNQIKKGDPLDEDTRFGALVSKEHLEKVKSYIELAKEEGGTVLTGGKLYALPGRCAGGYYLEPTVIEGLSPYCRTNQEEIFGPVVTLTPFRSEDEVLEFANSTSYGLAATLWTQNYDKALSVSEQIEAGIVWVNCWLERDLRTPFGGMKSSGVGREGGFQALDFFTEPKNICLAYNSSFH